MRRLWLPGLPVLAVIAACDDSPATPKVPADTVAPRVFALSPAPLARNVSRDATIMVTFTEPINPATVGVGSFLVRLGFDTVPGTYAFGDSTASFIPASRLQILGTYSVLLTRGIRDPAGNQLAADTAWSFQTASSIPAPPRR